MRRYVTKNVHLWMVQFIAACSNLNLEAGPQEVRGQGSEIVILILLEQPQLHGNLIRTWIRMM